MDYVLDIYLLTIFKSTFVQKSFLDCHFSKEKCATHTDTKQELDDADLAEYIGLR
jgi:hypothetical protein